MRTDTESAAENVFRCGKFGRCHIDEETLDDDRAHDPTLPQNDVKLLKSS